MGKVKLDRPSAAFPQVDEERPASRAEQVPLMRLAVQKLLSSAPATCRVGQATERGGEEHPVGSRQRRGSRPISNLILGVGDSLGEVRCLELDVA
jgi:hypothetical protein